MSAAELPPDLPVPEDDGAADRLPGAPIPAVSLEATDGSMVDLAAASRESPLVLYVYPSPVVPDGLSLPDWDALPGARGCTPQNCAFRDLHHDLRELGAKVHGLSAQKLGQQREFAEREQIPYALLNDSDLLLADRPGLPTFEAAGERLYRRLTLIAREGRIEKVLYPIFPPGSDAAEALRWLSARAHSGDRSP